VVRYTGQSNAYDIPNNIIYLGSLEYAWDVGDSLVGWTLGGNTVPTIAVDGRMRLYDATPGGGSSSAAIVIPNTKGQMLTVINFKFTRMLDDTSTGVAFAFHISSITTVVNGMGWYTTNALSNFAWRNSNYGGSLNAFTVPFAPVAGVEYSCSLIKTSNAVMVLINGELKATILVSAKGSAPLANTPLNDFMADNKNIVFYTAHGAGEVSHYRVRDIRVSRQVGKS